MHLTAVECLCVCVYVHLYIGSVRYKTTQLVNSAAKKFSTMLNIPAPRDLCIYYNLIA